MLPRSTTASIRLVVATSALVRVRVATSASARVAASAEFRSAFSAPTRSSRVLRTHLHAYACRIYVIAFRASIGLRPFSPPHPATPPLSASCSSSQRFALGFLRIRSRPRHPCLRLTLPLAGCVEDFHLQVRAPCRAHKKTPRAGGAFTANLWRAGLSCEATPKGCAA